MVPRWRRVFLPGVTGLIVAHLAGYLLCLIVPRLGIGLLGLHTGSTLLLRPWQLLTYPFAAGAFGMIGCVLMVVFLGSGVERAWKTGPLLLLWALATAGCGLLQWMLSGGGAVVAGGFGASFALLVVWGHLHRNLRLAMPPVRAQTLVWLVLGLYVLVALAQPGLLIWLAGAGIGWLYLRVLSKLEDRDAAELGGDSRPRKGVVDID